MRDCANSHAAAQFEHAWRKTWQAVEEGFERGAMNGMLSPLRRQISPSSEPSSCSSAQPSPLGWFHFVVSLPAELDRIAVAGSMNGASEAIEGEFAAGVIEQDVGARQGHIVARRLDDLPSASNAHAGAARSLGSRIRL